MAKTKKKEKTIMSPCHLNTLKSYGKTIISEDVYSDYGSDAIAGFCKEKIGLSVRIFAQDDEYFWDEDFKHSRKKSKTYFVEVI